MNWARILAYVTGTVDEELLAWNEYLVTENRILRAQLKGRLQLSDVERATLGEIGHRLAMCCCSGNIRRDGPVQCRERPGGLLRYYWRRARRLRKLDYSLGDYRNNRIGSVLKMQCRARQFERDAHDAFGLRIELMAVQLWEQEDNRLDQMNLWR